MSVSYFAFFCYVCEPLKAFPLYTSVTALVQVTWVPCANISIRNKNWWLSSCCSCFFPSSQSNMAMLNDPGFFTNLHALPALPHLQWSLIASSKALLEGWRHRKAWQSVEFGGGIHGLKLLKVHQVCHTFCHKNKKSASVETHLQIQLKSAMPSGSCTLAIRASGTSHWPKDPKRPRWWCYKYPIDHYATMQYIFPTE